jgi:starch phosphorylase
MLPLSVSLSIGSRDIVVRAWQYEVRGAGGFVVPLLLLSTDAPENTSEDREITAALYAGDDSLRLRQEVVLGIGGLRMLRALGYANIERFHLNEGHASLVGVGLLREEREAGRPVGDDIEAVKRRTVFTTHTPVAAGHDRFLWPLVREVLGEVVPFDELVMLGGRAHLDMTSLGLNLSQRVNAVAKRHGEVTRQMFPGQDVEAITNGVHSFTWTCDSFRRLYDRHLPGWAADPFALRHAVEIPAGEVWSAHLGAKLALLDEVEARTGRRLSEDALTIGFARRATAYKRAPLVVGDTDRLRDIASRRGPIQLVFAGKAHPQDESGKEGIRAVFRAAERLAPDVAVAWLPELDLRLSRLMTAGVDVWLNTPLRPLEASGTSGMKAAHNGIPSLSVLDGWWIEGHLEGVTGWSIGPRPGEPIGDAAAQDRRDASDLYEKLGAVVAPLFYGDRRAWIDLMRRTIAVNASFFNTHRMVQQYATSAYL